MPRLLLALVSSLLRLLGAGAAQAQIALVQSTGPFLTGQGTTTSGTFATAGVGAAPPAS